jgi:hypothetical protein
MTVFAAYTNTDKDPYLDEQVYVPVLDCKVTPAALAIATLPVFNMYTIHLNPTGSEAGTVTVFRAVFDIVIIEPLSVLANV